MCLVADNSKACSHLRAVAGNHSHVAFDDSGQHRVRGSYKTKLHSRRHPSEAEGATGIDVTFDANLHLGERALRAIFVKWLRARILVN